MIPIEQSLETLNKQGHLSELDIVILQAYQSGFRIEEIAKIVKVSRQTVSSRIDAMVTLLANLLGEEYYD